MIRKGLVVVLLSVGLAGVSYGQDWQQDILRLSEVHEGEHVHTAAEEAKPAFQPLKSVMNAALTVYQKVFSLQLSTNCIYELSCSRFSREAIRQYG
ncbi:MAG: membrane protein insertion efficiency factor YidD, partial [Bacteroidota bacterium]